MSSIILPTLLSVAAGTSYKNLLQNYVQGQGKGLKLPEYKPIPTPGTSKLMTTYLFWFQ